MFASKEKLGLFTGVCVHSGGKSACDGKDSLKTEGFTLVKRMRSLNTPYRKR